MRFVSLAIHQIGEHILDLFGGTCVRVLVLYQLSPIKGVLIFRLLRPSRRSRFLFENPDCPLSYYFGLLRLDIQ